MKFRHNNLTYDSDHLGAEAVEEIGRAAAFNRDVGRQTLVVLGFEPDHEFEPRVSESPSQEVRTEQREHSGFILEH